ncbi:MAG: prepilin-type N-terminal cleavage/methylation domain-containing protein, partial [Chthoniobacterales bacterium]
MSPHISDKKAFTLIELLIVIGIIAILMGLLFPALQGAINMAKKTAAKNDVTQIAQAVTAFEAEYGYLPASLDTTNGILGTNILGPLTNNNPRGIIFLDAPFQKRGKGGITT